MIRLAQEYEEKLTDGSIAYNVRVTHQDGQIICIIGAEDEASAVDIALSINAGAAWVTAGN